MYASAWPSHASLPDQPRRQRAEGRIRLVAARIGDATRVAQLSEQGSARLRLPRAPGPGLEAVTINTGGGITGGDAFSCTVTAQAGAQLCLSTAAAEKIYRSDGSTAQVSVDLSVESGARLDWLPQETIVFDKARLRRHFTAEIAEDARLLVFEALVFGRAAREERLAAASIEDRWRIRRGGRLVYADTLRLDDAVSTLLAKPAVAGGARALATLLFFAPEAESRLEALREALAEAPIEAGASAWNGFLALRLLSPEIEPLRACAARAITVLRGRPMPRVWLT